jgi:hypothetical protein
MSMTLWIELPWQQRLVDDMVDAYVQWGDECAAVQSAYDLWSHAAADDEDLAFGAYEAALDEEERSSQTYADLVKQVLSFVSPARDHRRPSRRALPSRMQSALAYRGFLHRLLRAREQVRTTGVDARHDHDHSQGNSE